MTTLVIVRHGQSVSNLNKTFTGQWDVPLTELGKTQAERTAKLLEAYPISVIYSSDLLRAMQTAEPTARQKGLEIIPDARLREIHGGDWEGKNGKLIEQLYPESHRVWKTDIANSRPNGGESFSEVYARANEILEEIVERHRGACVAVFSHALTIRTMASKWFGISGSSDELPWTTNASVAVVEYDDENKPHVKMYSYDKHQGELSTALAKGLS